MRQKQIFLIFLFGIILIIGLQLISADTSNSGFCYISNLDSYAGIGAVYNEQYCDLNGNWLDQKAKGESCLNDYECNHTYCIDSICQPKYQIIEQSLWDKILALFNPTPNPTPNPAPNPTGCSLNTDCTNPDFPVCNTDSNECVECLGDNDCASGQVCDSNNECQPSSGGHTGGTGGSGGTYNRYHTSDGLPCTSNSNNCYPGYSCGSDGICAYSYSGGNVSCSPNWTCDDWSNIDNQCGSRTCTDTNACGINLNKPATYKVCQGTCGDDICDPNNGETCNTCSQDCGACPNPQPKLGLVGWIILIIILIGLIGLVSFLIYKNTLGNTSLNTNLVGPKKPFTSQTTNINH